MVERDSGHEMMADVRADDVVEEMRVDEAEVAVDGGGCAACECPGCGGVVGEGGVGVLEEGYCYCGSSAVSKCSCFELRPLCSREKMLSTWRIG